MNKTIKAWTLVDKNGLRRGSAGWGVTYYSYIFRTRREAKQYIDDEFKPGFVKIKRIEIKVAA